MSTTSTHLNLSLLLDNDNAEEVSLELEHAGLNQMLHCLYLRCGNESRINAPIAQRAWSFNPKTKCKCKIRQKASDDRTALHQEKKLRKHNPNKCM
eukprot:4853303-Amphidinium_carterae.1